MGVFFLLNNVCFKLMRVCKIRSDAEKKGGLRARFFNLLIKSLRIEHEKQKIILLVVTFEKLFLLFSMSLNFYV